MHTHTDFDNSGKLDSANDFLYFNLGAKVQLGEFGVTATGEFLRYTIPSSTNGPSLALHRGPLARPRGLRDRRQPVRAGRGRAGGVDAAVGIQRKHPQPDQRDAAHDDGGSRPRWASLIKPNELPFRIGVTARAPSR